MLFASNSSIQSFVHLCLADNNWPLIFRCVWLRVTRLFIKSSKCGRIFKTSMHLFILAIFSFNKAYSLCIFFILCSFLASIDFTAEFNWRIVCSFSVSTVDNLTNSVFALAFRSSNSRLRATNFRLRSRSVRSNSFTCACLCSLCMRNTIITVWWLPRSASNREISVSYCAILSVSPLIVAVHAASLIGSSGAPSSCDKFR